MKNNFITKIIGATLAFAMMIGGAVGINAAKEARRVSADDMDETFTYQSQAGTYFSYSLAQNGGSTAPNTNSDIRIYNKNTLTFTANQAYADSVAITSVSITGKNSKSGKTQTVYYDPVGGTQVTSGTSISWGTGQETATRTATFTGENLTSVVFYQGGPNNVQISSVTVYFTYTATAATEATSMTISPNGPVSALVGETVTFTPTLSGGSGAYEKTISWASNNTSVAASPANSEDGEQVSVSILAAGSTTITGTVVNPGSASNSITINAKELSGIAVTTAPTKTTYNEGDSFDPSGMVVTATYSDSSTANVTSNCTFTPDPLTEDTTEVTIAYGDKTATQPVTVNAVQSVSFVAGTDVGSTTSNNSADQISKSGFIVSSTDAAFATAEYRLYSGSETTFSVLSGNIGRISITKNGNYSLSLLSLKDGEPGTWNSSTGIWTGSASSVTFVASAQFRADSFAIEKVSTEQTLTVDPSEITLKTYNSDGITITATVQNVDNPTFDWNKSNDNITLVPTENENEITVKPNTDVNATAKVLLDVGGANPAFERVEINVTLEAPVKGEIPEMAYTVAEAIESIDEHGNQSNVYVEGIISNVASYNSKYNSLTYYISDDGTTTSDQFEIYSGKGLNGANFSSVEDLVIGSSVIVYGNIQLYNSTYEFGANSSIYSLQLPPQVNSITLTPSEITVEPNEAGDIIDLFTNIVINQDPGSTKSINDIEWSSDDDSVFYIDGGEYLVAGAHRTSTTIRASINGTEYATATINVLDPNVHAMTYDSPEWRVVDNPSTLVAGDKVILTGVKSGTVYAAGTYVSGNNIPADTEHAITVANGVATGVQNEMIYTLEEGTAEGSLAFKDSTGKYLYAASSSSNYMKAQDDVDANASFIIDEDGNVVAQGTYSHNQMRYNSSNNLFSCYASGQTAIKFYKLSSGTAELDLFNLNSISEAHEDENGAYIRLGASLSEEDWAAMDTAFGIAGYGVMLIRETTLETTGFDSIEELYNSDSENKSKLSNLGKNSETAPQDFSVAAKINVRNDSDRNVVFCAAVYVKSSSGAIYFINETRGSLVGLL